MKTNTHDKKHNEAHQIYQDLYPPHYNNMCTHHTITPSALQLHFTAQITTKSASATTQLSAATPSSHPRKACRHSRTTGALRWLCPRVGALRRRARGRPRSSSTNFCGRCRRDVCLGRRAWLFFVMAGQKPEQHMYTPGTPLTFVVIAKRKLCFWGVYGLF